MTTTVPQWPTNRLLLSAQRLALTYVSNLALCFSKPLFCIAGPDPDSVGFEIKDRNFKRVILWIFSFYFTLFNTALSAAPQIPLLSEDAGIEPRTVATSALTSRRTNHSATSHPPKPDMNLDLDMDLKPGMARKLEKYLQCKRRLLMLGSPAWKSSKTYLQYGIKHFFERKSNF
jgi:hypothetical protein